MESIVLSPCHLTAADQPDTPEVSFAILTANKREELAVNGFLQLEHVDQAGYPHASRLQYGLEAVLRNARAKVEPLPDPRYTHRLFSLEVNGKKQMGVHVCCDKEGPLGAFNKTMELMKTAKDKEWKLRYIFIVGCCGASVTEAKKEDFPRGTILLAEKVKGHLSTEEEECVEDIAKEMVKGKAPTFKFKGSPTTYQMDSALLTQMIRECKIDAQGAFNKIEVKKVDYLSGPPLVIKSSLFGATFCDPSVWTLAVLRWKPWVCLRLWKHFIQSLMVQKQKLCLQRAFLTTRATRGSQAVASSLMRQSKMLLMINYK